jgi:hypothetical protein
MTTTASNGSMPNFDVSTSYNDPDLSELTFKHSGSSTDKGLVRSTHNGFVTADTGKQPGFNTFVSVQPLPSGLLRCIVGVNFTPVATTDDPASVLYGVAEPFQVQFLANPDFTTAEMIAQRMLFVKKLLSPTVSSGVPSPTRLWALLRKESNILPNG